MISRETRIMIRHQVNQGESKAIVARRLGVSRQTVYNHLGKSEQLTGEQSTRASKLDPYKNYVSQRLERFDLPATVLLREINQQGYAGGITIRKDFVRPLKYEKVRTLTRRFETEPGRQAQVDWGECGTITFEGVRRKLYVFVFVLGFSRMLFAKFTTSTKRPVFHRCLQEAFAELGIPEELVIDNMKQAVEAHTADGVKYAAEFLDFCEHHDVVPAATPPYWPRAKGKVERGVGYLKRSFLEGRSFTDLDDLNRQLAHWLDTVANVRVHGTTARVPVESYRAEQSALRQFESVPHFDTRPSELRKVHTDSHIRFENVFYSVDPSAVGHSVVVKSGGEAIGDLIEVYDADRLVGVHRRVPESTRRVTSSEHERKIRELTRRGGAIRGRSVAYTQILTPETLTAWSPEVQTRTLEIYEQLLGSESRQ